MTRYRRWSLSGRGLVGIFCNSGQLIENLLGSFRGLAGQKSAAFAQLIGDWGLELVGGGVDEPTVAVL